MCTISKHTSMCTFKAGTSAGGMSEGRAQPWLSDRLCVGVCWPPWLHTGNDDPGCCNSHSAGRQQTLWKPSQEEEGLSFCSDISKYSLAFPYLSLDRHGRIRRGEFTR